MAYSLSCCLCFSGSIQELLFQFNTAEGKLAWKCSICGKDFFHKSSGTRHVETMHYESPSQECEVCGKVLKNKNSYQNHIAITHGIKRRGLKWINRLDSKLFM